MKILALCSGDAERLPGKSYKTGIFKRPLTTPVMVDSEGLVGDAICNRKHHGGPDQALYGLGSVDLDWWSDELGEPLIPGTFGENIVIDGVDSRTVSVGDRFETENVRLEVTSVRVPCATFSARMNDPQFVKRFYAAGRPGFYLRVLAGGTLEAGEAIRHIPFAGEAVTMPELLATYGLPLSAADLARYLAAPISTRLRALITG